MDRKKRDRYGAGSRVFRFGEPISIFAPLRLSEKPGCERRGSRQGANTAKENDISNSARSSSCYRPVSPEQQHGAEDGGDPSGRIPRPSPQHAPDNRSDQRAGHSDDRGDNDPPWIAPRHQQFRNNADHQPEKYLTY